MTPSAGHSATLDPVEADAETGQSSLLRALREAEPSLTVGPLDCTRQQWIATARHASEATAAPEEGNFMSPTEAATFTVTPWRGGLYTSTASSTGVSTWRYYLDAYRGSMLFPLPWQTWKLPAAGRVREIVGAGDWVSFVGRYPRVHEGLVYPDWEAAARDFDGLHMSLQGVVAVQGFTFQLGPYVTAPGYWDAETTYWLRWAFGAPQLLETTR
jgi:hypothetical protein